MSKELIIDGIKVEPDPSKTVLEVAQELGIHIPTLCYYKGLTPYGACRICVVETIWKGKSKLQTACTFPAWEGEVRTNSEKVRKARKSILELMLAEAPEAKEIQKLAEEYGADREKYKVHRFGPNNKCIMCGLCVRICNDIIRIGAIGFKERGYKREITTPFEEYSDICSTCGACSYVCPTNAIDLKVISDRKITPVLSEFECGLTTRPAVYTPFPQAVPNIPIIDKDNCMHFLNNSCDICELVCEPEAIKYDQEDKISEEEVGAIVVATGYELYPILNLEEYGAGEIEDVIDGLAFERLLSSSGPTVGEIRRPSDGKIAKDIVFIQCAGSRDPEKHKPYCSRICCMYSTKQAMLFKHHVHKGQPYIFYIDIRSGGKGYEEFV
ncbi:MAG: 4Fe-4S dicluster domain-containing protein, partial [Candidatus Stahlbacteria bacterium]